VGGSGAGKSTLIRCLNGLETIDEGTILFEGKPLAKGGKELQRTRARISMVFQQFNLYPHMRVLQNLTLAPIRVKGVSREQAEQEALRLLEKVGLKDKAHALPMSLSGGQQQRVAIARALATNPALLLFDEPTSALDPEMVHEVLEVMADLARSGSTMCIVTHEMGFARKVADRVVFLAGGRVVEVAAPEQFFTRPNDPRLKQFLARIHTF
jgi:glutamate transport system ATP-binding protein